MAEYPKSGERYRNANGLTVRVVSVQFNDKLRTVNPEFYCEVRYVYEQSGKHAEMPASWFNATYRRIPGEVGNHNYASTFFAGSRFPDYSWLDDDD